MTENKLTEAEIMAALEYCSNLNNTCEKCVLYDPADDGCECASKLRLEALDLINSKNAEIESLYKTLDYREKNIRRLEDSIKQLNTDIEKLQEKNKILDLNRRMAWKEKEVVYEKIKSARAEAIKEFIARAKELMGKYCGEITEEDLDQIAEEMGVEL